jgi:hypothetical protein
MSSQSQGQSGNEPIDMIDIVFTVALGIGLTPEVLGHEKFHGILSEGWVYSALWGNWQQPCKDDWFRFFTLFLGLLTLLLSWFGVHSSLKSHAIKYEFIGMCRFFFDITLVILYLFILIFFRNFCFVMILLFIVYLFYFVWDILKTLEYRGLFLTREGQEEKLKDMIRKKALRKCQLAGRPDSEVDQFLDLAESRFLFLLKGFPHRRNLLLFQACFGRQLASLVFCICFGLLLFWYYGSFSERWCTLLLAIAFTILYRFSKEYLWPGLISTVVAWIVGIIFPVTCRLIVEGCYAT